MKSNVFTFRFLLLIGLIYVQPLLATDTSYHPEKNNSICGTGLPEEKNQLWNSMCSVDNFTITEVTSCSGEMRNVRFTFTGNDFGLHGFTVTANGGNPQQYELGSNYVYQMTSQCHENIVLVIRDNDNELCADTLIWDPICCPCLFEFDVLEQTACENGMFDAIFSLHVASGSCLWYWNQAILTVNGVEYDFFHLTGNHYRVNGISSNQQENHYVFTFPTPSGEFRQDVLPNHCFGDCEISGFVVETGPSLCSGEFAVLEFDFTGQNFGTHGYTILSNFGHEFHFEAGSNRNFEMIADCENEYIFTIMDDDHPDCSATFTFGALCCPCEGEYFVVEESACTSNGFNAWHRFEYESGSCFGHDFTLTINGENYPIEWINANTFRILHIQFPNDSLLVYELCSTIDTTECFVLVRANPCYQSQPECSIVFEAIHDLECENGQIHATLIIIGQNISQTGFDVYLNDSFVLFLPYEADSLYNIVLPDPGTQGFVLTICDNDHPDCCREREFTNPCYETQPECSIVFEAIHDLECENGQIHGTLIIIGQNISQTGFDVYLNDSFVLFLPYEADSLYNIVLPDPGTQGFILTICDNDHPNCCREREFTNPCYETQPECSIVFEAIHDLECENGQIHGTLFINGQNLSMTGFDVYLNDSLVLFLPYEADHTYTVVLPDPGTQGFVLTICDNDHPDCCREREFTNPCYETQPECSIVFEAIHDLECENGQIHGTLIIIGQNISQTGFDVYLNDSFVLFLPYEADSLYNIVLPDPGTQGFILTICDNDHPDCCREREFSNPCYETQPECSIVFEAIHDLECENGQIHGTLIIIGQNISQTGFDVYLNDSFVLFLPYEADSLYNIVLPDPGTQGFILTICDNDHPDCCREREFDNPCVEGLACTFDEFSISIDSLGGDSITIDVFADMNGNCPDSLWMSLFVNNHDSLGAWIINGHTVFTIPRVTTDSIYLDICVWADTVQCHQVVFANPFSSESKDFVKTKIRAFSAGKTIIIKNPALTLYHFILTDVYGQQLYRGVSDEMENIYRPATEIPSGVYLLTIYENHRFYTFKLFIHQE